MTDDRKKEYRILALAVAFFLIGLFFFFRNGSPPTSPTSPISTSPKKQVASAESVRPAGSVQPLSPKFANFPLPSRFRKFTYDGTGLNGSASLAIGAVCHDAYVAILIFPAAVDYRSNADAAIYNIASPCDFNKAFDVVIHPTDLGHAPSGTYYFFTADQGTAGTWYNPT
jgi:hypothetical protein